jgi:lysophospholipase L1-like esterase
MRPPAPRRRLRTVIAVAVAFVILLLAIALPVGARGCSGPATTPLGELDFDVMTNAEGICSFDTRYIMTFTDDDAQSITLSDNGASGTFTPGTTLELAAGQAFITAGYSPVAAGEVTLDIRTNTGETISKTIFFSPYATTIGFIGDSLSYGLRSSTDPVETSSTVLVAGVRFDNRAVSGSTAASWLSDGETLSNSLTSFANNDVEVVHIMLGANDAATQPPAEEYKADMQGIIDRLHAAGIRLVIVSNPIYSPELSSEHLTAYATAIAELVQANNGYVLQGDTAGYEAIRNRWSELSSDGIHLNDAGYTLLGELWASAIMEDLHHEAVPTYHWLDAVDFHERGSTTPLTLVADKYGPEFAEHVTIDGEDVDLSQYAFAAVQSSLAVSPAYLNTLAPGEYTLTLWFKGGVRVQAPFVITAGAVPFVPVWIILLIIVAVAVLVVVAAVILVRRRPSPQNSRPRRSGTSRHGNIRE